MKSKAKESAGILVYHKSQQGLEVLLVHPGGPFWAKKDLGAWSIPKGEIDDPQENPLKTAQREFEEETGSTIDGKFIPLTPVKQKSGKLIMAWGVEGNCDPTKIKSNTFRMEWPPKSGREQEFPEVDRASFFQIDEAKKRINTGQIPLLDELQRIVTGEQL